MTAKSMTELKKILQRKLKTAVNEARENAEKAVQSTVDQFYSASPLKYARTGTLAESIHVSDVLGDGDSLSFEADILPNVYATGSHPTAQTVAGWAMSGAARVQGHLDWQGTGEKLKRILDESVKSHFGGR